MSTIPTTSSTTSSTTSTNISTTHSRSTTPTGHHSTPMIPAPRWLVRSKRPAPSSPRVDESNASNPTPCAEWNAFDLARHLIAVLERAAAGPTDEDINTMPLLADVDLADLVTEAQAAAERVHANWADSDAMETMIARPLGRVSRRGRDRRLRRRDARPRVGSRRVDRCHARLARRGHADPPRDVEARHPRITPGRVHAVRSRRAACRRRSRRRAPGRMAGPGCRPLARRPLSLTARVE